LKVLEKKLHNPKAKTLLYDAHIALIYTKNLFRWDFDRRQVHGAQPGQSREVKVQ
jgi:hypothetical protein